MESSGRQDPSVEGTPRYSLLDSVGAVFELNRRERQERLDNMQAKQLSEREHSRYLQSILPQSDMAEARTAVNQWARKHQVTNRQTERQALRELQQRTNVDAFINRANSSLLSQTASRPGSVASLTGPRSSDMAQPAPRSRPSAQTGNQKPTDTLVLSDSEEDEEEQMKLAIGLSLSLSAGLASNPNTASDSNSNVNVDINGTGASRQNDADVNTNMRGGMAESADTPEGQTLRCAILNCEAEFSTWDKLESHRLKLFHSPCHPCLAIVDLKSPEHVLSYDCPQCGQQFKDELACQDHQSKKRHRSFLPVVPTCGYMCCQCLTIYPDKSSCQKHMDTLNHTDISYPFEDDFLSLSTSPAPVSAGFIHDLVTQSSKVEFSLHCIDCDSAVQCNKELDHRAYNPEHIVSASACKSLSDVFIEYVNSCQCDQCGAILSPNEGTIGEPHNCMVGHVGILSETKVRTFAEFIRLVGLKFILQSVGELVVLSATLNSSHISSVADSSMLSIGQPETSGCNGDDVFEVEVDQDEFNLGKMRRKRQRSSAHASEGNMNKRPKVLCESGHQEDPEGVEETRKKSLIRSRNQGKKVTLDRLVRARKVQRRQTNIEFITLLADSEEEDIGQNARENTVTLTSVSSHSSKANSKPKSTASNSNSNSSDWVDPNSAQKGVKENLSVEISGPVEKRNCINTCYGVNNVFCQRADFRPPPNINNFSFISPPDLYRAPSAEYLRTMKLLVFLDLDNWPSFFKKLPRCLPEGTFVWAFWGGNTFWREPHGFASFTEQKRKGGFHLHKKSGRTKDAADFALVLQVGKMNALLQNSIPFTILSGDNGFIQIEKEIAMERRLVVINPHTAHKHSPEMFYTMIISVCQS